MMTHPAESWPTWANHLWAKSTDRGGDSLAQHTWQVLCRLSDQYRLRPHLPDQLGEPRLWTRLFWACFLHDFGKAASGFQAMLQKKVRGWDYRHEVLSLAFVEWVVPPEHPDFRWLVAAIVSHHRDADYVFHEYSGNPDRLDTMVGQVDNDTLTALWRWLTECSPGWIGTLDMVSVVEQPGFLSLEQAQARFGRQAIQRALDDYNDWCLELEDSTFDRDTQANPIIMAGIHLRGLILTADHSASAHTEPFPSLHLSRPAALGDLKPNTLHHHQEDAEATGARSAILVAPTGSGKTEAALLWAARQISDRRPPRLFYVLPYQASMNAMQHRLAKEKKHFPEQHVGLRHGRALQSLYHQLLTLDGSTPEQAAEKAKLQNDLARLNYYPVRIFSPYQMLKVAYKLKGFEALLTDFYDALFIFDEIHAYEPKRLALIVRFMAWLARNCQARFFVMTATLPPMVRAVLEEALPGCGAIQADEKTFANSRRHQVKLLDGELLDPAGLDAIVEAVNSGRSVLVCLNTVQRAQDAYEALNKRLCTLKPDQDIVLVHGRFNARDRQRKEQRIRAGAGVGQQREEPIVVVATQVVEVSLNIDLDTIYTDPAPLEALLQRFGRVNRGRKPGGPLADVHVFRQPTDGQRIYDAALVQRGLAELEKINNKPIDEAQVSAMLERVYEGEVGEAWWWEYRAAAEEFEHIILSQLYPFQSADAAHAQLFYRLFDGVEVLPQELEDTYNKLCEGEGGYLEASSLLVSISWGQYMQLHQLCCTVTEPQSNDWPKIVDVPYNDKGLDLDAVRQRKPAEREDQ